MPAISAIVPGSTPRAASAARAAAVSDGSRSAQSLRSSRDGAGIPRRPSRRSARHRNHDDGGAAPMTSAASVDAVSGNGLAAPWRRLSGLHYPRVDWPVRELVTPIGGRRHRDRGSDSTPAGEGSRRARRSVATPRLGSVRASIATGQHAAARRLWGDDSPSRHRSGPPSPTPPRIDDSGAEHPIGWPERAATSLRHEWHRPSPVPSEVLQDSDHGPIVMAWATRSADVEAPGPAAGTSRRGNASRTSSASGCRASQSRHRAAMEEQQCGPLATDVAHAAPRRQTRTPELVAPSHRLRHGQAIWSHGASRALGVPPFR